MRRTTKSVDEYLNSIESRQGDEMRLLDAAIVERMPGHERRLYEGRFWGGTDQQIIGYGVMDYTNRSGEEVEWFIVGLAAQKKYTSVYVNAVKDDAYLLREYEVKLGKARVGSASISFETIDDLKLDNLYALIEEAGKIT